MERDGEANDQSDVREVVMRYCIDCKHFYEDSMCAKCMENDGCRTRPLWEEVS